jgi:hypothetical protein
MSRLTSEYQGALNRLKGDDGWRRSRLSRRQEPFGVPNGMLVAGLVAVGIGLLAIYYVGPDVKRYMKLRDM